MSGKDMMEKALRHMAAEGLVRTAEAVATHTLSKLVDESEYGKERSAGIAKTVIDAISEAIKTEMDVLTSRTEELRELEDALVSAAYFKGAFSLMIKDTVVKTLRDMGVKTTERQN